MSERERSTFLPLPFGRAFLGGVALAWAVFLVVHFEDTGPHQEGWPPVLGLACLLIGWLWAGIPWPGRRRLERVAKLIVAVAAPAFWLSSAAVPFEPSLPAYLGMVLLGALLRWGAGRDPRAIAFLVGCGAGFCATSAGLPALIGVAPAVQCLVVAGAVATLCQVVAGRSESGRREVPAEAPIGAAALSRGFLCAAAGMLAGLALHTYSSCTGWAAYATSDLGIAFCAGFLFCLVAMRRGGGGRRLAAAALALLAVTVLLESSFLFYPDLIFSESAALQSGRTLLGPERMLPLWFVALALGALVPVVGAGRRDGRGPRFGLVSASLAVAFLALPGVVLNAGGSVHSAWRYLAPAGLCVLGLVPICASKRLRAGLGGIALPVAVAALALGGLAWTVFGATRVGWRALEEKFEAYRAPAAGRLNCEPPGADEVSGQTPVETEAVRFTPWGLEAVVRAGDEKGRFFCGNLVSTSRSLDSCSVRLTVACALASCNAVRSVGVLDPALEETRLGIAALAPDAEVRAVDISGWMGGRVSGLDAVICGPGPLAAARCPLDIVSVESLKAVRESLNEGGVMGLWLPMRTLRPRDLRRVLATVLAAFDRVRLFTCRDEMVLVAGGRDRISYTRLRSFFRDERARSYLGAGGFWDPRHVVVCLTATHADLADLAGDAQPYSLAYPSRPPVLARDLSLMSRADVPALLAYCRFALADDLPGMLHFASPNERAVALRGLRELYETRTQHIVQGVASVARARPRQLVRVLTDERTELDLFAPDARSRRIKLAAALYEFGLHQRSLRILAAWQAWARSAPEGAPVGDRTEAFFWQGRNLEKMGRIPDAVRAYESALAQNHRLPHVLMRLAGLHLQQGRTARAEGRVDAVLAFDPDNVKALLLRSHLYARRRLYDRAAQTARRALKLDPENRAASEFLKLYQVLDDVRGE